MANTNTNTNKSVFETLRNIDVTNHVKEKNGYRYIPWADAWGLLLEKYPDSTYEVFENPATCTPYFTDGARALFVKVSVTVEGKTNTEIYPVINHKNEAISQDKVTAMDINKAIQRGLTKAIARHGLGLYIYEDEDLPPEMAEEKKRVEKKDKPATSADKLKWTKFCAENGLNASAITKEVGLEKGAKLTNEQLDMANEIAKALASGSYEPKVVTLEELFVTDGAVENTAPATEEKAENAEEPKADGKAGEKPNKKTASVEELATKKEKAELIAFCKENNLDVMAILSEIGHDKEEGELTEENYRKAFALAKEKAA